MNRPIRACRTCARWRGYGPASHEKCHDCRRINKAFVAMQPESADYWEYAKEKEYALNWIAKRGKYEPGAVLSAIDAISDILAGKPVYWRGKV